MVATLLRQITSGFQDSRLTGKELKIDPFLYVLIKAGRFTTQWQRLDFITKPAFGSSSVCTLQRKGHLLSRLYLVANMPDIRTSQQNALNLAGPNFVGPIFGWTNSLGHALINYMSLEIGGARVEQMDGRLLEVLDEFNTPIEKVQNVNRLIQRVENGYNSKTFGWSSTPTQVVVPLPFWFSRGDLGVALPVDGLYADEIRCTINFTGLSQLYTTSTIVPTSTNTSNVVHSNSNVYVDTSGQTMYQMNCSSGPMAMASIYNSPFYQDISGVVAPIPGVSMQNSFFLGDTYLMAEYITLDKPEANRFRQAEFTLPIIQHYPLDVVNTKGQPSVSIPIRIPNPARNLFFFCQRTEATDYNNFFLATRELNVPGKGGIWWPDCSGLNMETYTEIIPGFSTRSSEPLLSMSVLYEGKFVKASTENMALYRTILPALELRKSPLINRYYYYVPFGLQSGKYPGSIPLGEANLDKIPNITFNLEFNSLSKVQPDFPNYNIYMWVETYNIFKVFGGRGGLLFGY
jgi:hypothetical protein